MISKENHSNSDKNFHKLISLKTNSNYSDRNTTTRSAYQNNHIQTTRSLFSEQSSTNDNKVNGAEIHQHKNSKVIRIYSIPYIRLKLRII
jgi:hypothetical protein